MRGLLKLRVLFKGGPYMRKYGNWDCNQEIGKTKLTHHLTDGYHIKKLYEFSKYVLYIISYFPRQSDLIENRIAGFEHWTFCYQDHCPILITTRH